MAAFFAERARGGVGLIVTGGFAPNIEGWAKPFAGTLATSGAARRHKPVTDAVHAEGGKIALQILHTGRYGYHPLCVAPSRIKSPISPFTPRELTARGIERQIRAFVRCARLAREAGYDGVEVMGSEGYFINQFLVTHTNQAHRPLGRRLREPHAAAGGDRAPRARGGGAGLHHHLPLSMLDLIPDGSSWPEVVQLAKAVAAAGATILNTGIGWHEARVPTIATSVPRGAFAWVTKKMREELRAGHRHPAGHQQPHQHARGGRAGAGRRLRRHGQPGAPFLADPDFVARPPPAAARDQHLHRLQPGLPGPCLQEPAGELPGQPARRPRDRAVHRARGRGPQARRGGGRRPGRPGRGHHAGRARPRGAPVRRRRRIGGQFNMAKRIPGKEEFDETLRYFGRGSRSPACSCTWHARVRRTGGAGGLRRGAAGHRRDAARPEASPAQELPNVLSYIDVLLHNKPVGQRVAIVGAGGIGFDVAEFLATADPAMPRPPPT
jgi:2,4-dienoyl-CoA reductase (NADPH2)